MKILSYKHRGVVTLSAPTIGLATATSRDVSRPAADRGAGIARTEGVGLVEHSASESRPVVPPSERSPVCRAVGAANEQVHGEPMRVL